MQQLKLDLEDKDLEKKLNTIFFEIDEGNLDDDEYIVSDLSSILSELQNEGDKERALIYINRKYRNRAFLELGNFLIQEQNNIQEPQDYKLQYQELKEQRNFEQLIEMSRKRDFCEINKIPNQVQQNLVILQKLGIKYLDFLEIVEEQQMNSDSLQFNILKKLMLFAYDRMPVIEDQMRLEQLIGSLLRKQILQLLFYIEQLMVEEGNQFQEFVNIVQNMQLQITVEHQKKIEMTKIQKFLTSLFTSDSKQSHYLLNQYLQTSLMLKNTQLTYDSIIEQLEQFIFLNINIQECYFQIVWYFWTQYVCQGDYLKDLTDFRSRKFDDSRKPIMYQRQLDKMKINKQEDLIFQNFIQWTIYFDPNIKKGQEYHMYKIEQMKLLDQQTQLYGQKALSLEEILCIKEEEFLKLWEVIKNLQYNYILTHIRQKQDIRLFQFLWRQQIDSYIQKSLKLSFKKISQLNLFQYVQIIQTQFPEMTNYFIVNLLSLTSQFLCFNQNEVQLLIKSYINQGSFEESEELLKLYSILKNKCSNLESLKYLMELPMKNFQLISQFINNDLFIDYIKEALKVYLKEIKLENLIYLNVFQRLLANCNVEGIANLECLKILLSIDETDLHKLLMNNSNGIPQLPLIEKTIKHMLSLYKQADQNVEKLKLTFENIDYFITQKFYNFKLILSLKQLEIQDDLIIKIINSFYYHETQGNDLQINCQEIYNQNEKIYILSFQGCNYFDNFTLSPECLRISKIFNSFPKNKQLTLEEFNISLVDLNDTQQEEIIINWLNRMEDGNMFDKLIPFFFNIIKRGESPDSLLQIIHSKKSTQCCENFNMKSLFQIFYNNSNYELQTMLLKFRSKTHPVPFLYLNSSNTEPQTQADLFTLNNQIFYIFPPCHTVINFSLSEKTNQIGKTSLINQIFYETKPFETNDTSQINKGTIDIMFDFCFNGSRDLAIADSHGVIPLDIYSKILPLFKLWIVQMDSERELEYNFNQILQLEDIIKSCNPLIFFIVRNSDIQQQEGMENLLCRIKNMNITIYFMQNLTEKNLDQQIISNEFNNVSKEIFKLLETQIQKNDDQNSKINKFNFLKILNIFSKNCKTIAQQMETEEELIVNLEKELHNLIKTTDGFFNQEAFPLRYQDLKIKEQKKVSFVEEQPMDEQTQLLQQSKNIEQEKEGYQTKILQLFCQIFEKQENYYILYLLFVERIRKFNEEQTKELQYLNQHLIEETQKKKKERDQCPKEDVELAKRLKIEMESLKCKCTDVQKSITLKNIGIEIFWREVIQQNQMGMNYQLNIDPAQIFFQMIEKGEPFEFLDGDQLKINSQFLQTIINKFGQKGKEKILVLSVLGPQSSGKSTILNKIFGCHFWTSVGRCTKGIYLQLLKVNNKEVFENQFDYILLLDTEGLQNPNQHDPDFDKKIALFVLLISDIIIINVKGDINAQFRNLVEMCIYTLGQMKTNFQFLKLLSWCFNQNNDISKIETFLDQIQAISNNLNKEYNKDDNDEQRLDYTEILEIKKQNIQILGFSSYEKSWKSLKNINLCKEWRQQMTNETFSQEATLYGTDIIHSYVKKFKQQTDYKSMSNLNHFVQNIAGSWDSIQRLPDLLEFSELIQHQQNSTMKTLFDKKYSEQDFSFILNISEDIKNEIQKQEMTNKLFDQIKEQKESYYTQKISDIQQNVSSFIETIKETQKISKKITQKYIKQLEQLIKGQINECRTLIFEAIKNLEREHQQQQGIESLNQFIIELYSDQKKLEYFQQNPDKITEEFNKRWSKIVLKLQEQQNQLFVEYQSNQYNQMTQISKKYALATEHAPQYYNFFRKINQQNPKDNSSEKEDFFSLFKQELNQQFMILEKNQKNLQYINLLNLSIEKKIEYSSASDLICIKQLFYFTAEWQVLEIKAIKEYLNNHFFEDFKNTLVKCKKEKLHLVNNFFLFLVIFQIPFSSELLSKLFDVISSFKSYFLSNQDEIEFAFKKLTGSFETNKWSAKLMIKNADFKSSFSQYYPNLAKRLQRNNQVFESLKAFEMMREEFLDSNIIFNQTISVMPRQKNNSFHQYILDPKQEFSDLLPFLPKNVNDLMIDQQGWQKLYFYIYDFIQEEMTKLNTSSRVQINSTDIQIDDENNAFNNNSLKNLMKRVEQNIQIFNEQFSQFGVVLKDSGERCIYYFSMLIIWRFGCFKKWQHLLNNQKALENSKETQLNKFMTEIKKDKKNQSILKAQSLVHNIFVGIQNSIYPHLKVEASKLIKKYEISSRDLITRLDNDILFSSDKSKDKEKIIEYIKNQYGYIQQYADAEMKRIKKSVLSDIEKTKKLNNHLISTLNQVLHNANLLKQKIVVEEQYMKNYFKLENQNTEDQTYESNLYKIVCGCLLGNQLEIKYNVKQNYQDIFQQSFLKIENPFVIISQNTSDQQIQQLKCFVEEICNQLQLKINEAEISVKVEKQKLCWQNQLQELKFKMIGCLDSCPMCQRKCDLDNDNHEQHECRNGHQLRGMNYILIGNYPSLFTCEEIQNDYQIVDRKSTKNQTWSQIVSAHPKWKFKSLSTDELQSHKQKMMAIWNGGIGKKLCSQMRNELKTSVFFREKHDLDKNTEKVHYIIMLDTSLSMILTKYSKAEKGAQNCIKSLKSNKNAKVSVLLFDSKVKIIYDCEQATKIPVDSSFIWWCSGNTNFQVAFQKAFQQITEHKSCDFSRIIILFYTDGEATYPKEAIDSFKIMDEELRSRVTLIASCEANQSLILSQIVDELRPHCQKAELNLSTQADQIELKWQEEIKERQKDKQC